MTAYSQNCVTLVVEKLVTVADFKRQPRQKYGSTIICGPGIICGLVQLYPKSFLMIFRDEAMD